MGCEKNDDHVWKKALQKVAAGNENENEDENEENENEGRLF